jgi:glutaminase
VSIATSPLSEILTRIHHDLAGLDRGEIADYIPELSRANPDSFGIAIATVDGHVFGVGDAELPFTIQSISKPLVFGMALEARGDESVLDRVGVEPSGNAFNSITVDAETNRPFNPMVNAGAIVSTALVGGSDPAGDRDRMLEQLSRFAGRPLIVDEAVYRSEKESGDRNRAIAWLMSSFGMIDGDVEAAVDLYFAQCSVLVSCRDLALIGATLANDGIHPVTCERALRAEHVTKVLSVMATCGMYDNAGAWMYNVGLPAKSGVAGGVLAVLPGQLGVGVFSPPLDPRGNSVRGTAVCERLSRDLQLHLLARGSGVQSVVRRVLRGDELRSNRLRTLAEDDAIASARSKIGLFELQGQLYFATAERAHREIADRLGGTEYVLIDLTRVSSIDEPALAVLDGLAESLIATGRTLLAVLDDPHSGWAAKLPPTVLTFPDTDTALEWCEDRLVESGPALAPDRARWPFGQLDLLEGLEPPELAAVAAAAEVRGFDAGATVLRAGDPAREVCFLLEGRVSVLLPLGDSPGGPARRLASFGPGLAFGELALLSGEVRSADVVCEEMSTVAFVSIEILESLAGPYPGLRSRIEANLVRLLSRRLRTANAQVRALAR